MNEASLPADRSVPPPADTAPRHPWYHWRRLGLNFLTASLVAHLLFGLVAAYLIVQRLQPQRKQTFAGAPGSANASTRAVEHKVQMQKTKQTMSAPVAVKRVTTTANSKVALPSMPTMANADAAVMPVTMAGMGGTGMGLAMSSGGGGGGGGGGGLNLFGVRGGGVGLTGTFYDLKQTTGRQPTNMTPAQYDKILVDFANGGFNLGMLSRFYKSDKPIYTTQIWIPNILADLGPAAFQLEKVVQPKMWCVHYKGKIIAPGSFTFHFVGAGDDMLLVRFNGKLVLNRGYHVHTSWQPQANYQYNFSTIRDGFAKGDAITVEAGQSYPIEVMIGEEPGGRMYATLLQEIDGASYDKDSRGSPILPVFRMSSAKPTGDAPGRLFPPHRDDGPVWKPEAAPGGSSSIFSR